MNRDFPGIRMHLGYYGPPLNEEPIAQMKPRLAGCEVEQVQRVDQRAVYPERTSRVDVRVEVDGA
jgi:hypothetical protein